MIQWGERGGGEAKSKRVSHLRAEASTVPRPSPDRLEYDSGPFLNWAIYDI
jgi:hypothetical protein